jgi:hypothetical protein
MLTAYGSEKSFCLLLSHVLRKMLRYLNKKAEDLLLLHRTFR